MGDTSPPTAETVPACRAKARRATIRSLSRLDPGSVFLIDRAGPEAARAGAAPVAIREAATLAVLCDRDAGLHVLLLRRAASHVFGAHADVYPGGAVDAHDHRLAVAQAANLPDAAWRIAAIRECFEEAGLLPACDGPVPDDARVPIRAALCAGTIDWAEACRALSLRPRPERLVGFAEWTTPPGAPKRYATHFYAVAVPEGPAPVADGHETVAAEWVCPVRALDEARHGRRRLMTPTRATLEQLAGYTTTAEALAGLASAARR